VAGVRLERVTKTFRTSSGEEKVAVRELSLEARRGELLALLGPSGSGKTTTLRLIAGLEKPDAGRVWIGGRDAAGLPPGKRDVAMAFQTDALYPHLSALENMAFPLRLRGASRAEARRRAAEIAALLGVEGLLDRLPRELSGGERQRVALGRALARRARITLLDEPLAHVDPELRRGIWKALRAAHRRAGGAWVWVTHDHAEALALGDRVAAVAEGALQQIGSPREILDRPANLFVARFVGRPPINLFHGTLSRVSGSGVFHWGEADALAFPVPETALPAGVGWGPLPAVMGVRPGDLVLEAGEGTRPGAFEARVVLVELASAGAVARLEARGMEFAAATSGDPPIEPGELVWARPRTDRALFFDPAAGKLLPPE